MPTLRTLAPAPKPGQPPEPPTDQQPALAPSGPADPQKYPVTIGPSGIEGTGAFAVQAIPARHKIGEIRGVSVSTKVAFERARQARRDSGHVFMIAVSDKRSIDASDSTDPLRFANHHCEPNMVIKVQQGRVAFHALRDIAAGEELTARYGPTHHAGKLACRCGAPRCQGWL